MEANKPESEYRWLEAAKLYERRLSSAPDNDSQNVKHWKKIGFCYSLGSRQSRSFSSHIKLARLSAEAYENAAKILEKTEGPSSSCEYWQCRAFSEYNRSLATTTPQAKKQNLEKCLTYGKRSLKAFKQVNNEPSAGITNNLLAMCVFDLHDIITSSAGKTRVIQEGLHSAELAAEIFSKLQKKDELIHSLSMASLLSVFLSEVSDQENNKKLSNLSKKYSEEALEVAHGTQNPYSKAMALWARANHTIWFEEQIEKRKSLEFPHEMLKQASIVKDNYLMGMAYHHLAYALYADIREELDPEQKKKKYEQIIEYSKNAERFLLLVGQDSCVAVTYMFYAESYLSLAKEFSSTRTDKLSVVKNALTTGNKGIKYGRRSGSPFAMQMTLIALSRINQYCSMLEQTNAKKRGFLNKALGYRKEEISSTKKTFPFNTWYTGVGMVEIAQIDAELAKLEKSRKNKERLFEEATEYMKLGISRCKKTLEFADVPAVQVRIADYEDMLGEMLEEQFSLENKKECLSAAIEAYADAAENFERSSLPSRTAECFWKIAKNQDRMGDYDNASKSFEKAFDSFNLAGSFIPQFNDFYADYASYVRAWSEIEKAKSAHSHEEYISAMRSYEEASSNLKGSKSWNYLSLNFSSWALLEHAEDLSRKDLSKESIALFRQAVDSFGASKKLLSSKLEKVEKPDEKLQVKLLIDVSEAREQFSRGRIAVEEAKLLDRQGDSFSSCEKYGVGKEIFHSLIQTNSEQICQEAQSLYYLCQAWEKLTLAEAKVSPDSYEEAAELFKEANKHAISESSSLLALAHSSFCQAMGAGTLYETSRRMTFYKDAKKYLDAAATCYLKAGFEAFSEYAKATQCLFDAYFFMDNAKRETDPNKEARFYLMAEKVLEISNKSFVEANYGEKANQVKRLLTKVKEEKDLALSLSQVLNAPAVTASSASFGTLSLVEEKAVGLERFAHADIQAKIVCLQQESKVGEYVSFKIELINTGKESVLLTKIEGLAPDGFQLIGKPENCTSDDTGLAFKGRQLSPLKTDEVSFVVRPFRRGSFEFRPRLICVDQAGDQILCDPDSFSLSVSGASQTGKLTTGFSDLDDLLLGGIPEGYAIALSSPSNDAREMLINKFLESGVKNHQLTYYVTSETGGARNLTDEYPSTFFLFICSPIADVGPKAGANVFRLSGVENLTEINISIIKALRSVDQAKQGCRRVCLGILSDVLLQHHAVIARKWLSGFISDLKSKGFTILAIINRQMHPQEEVEAVISLFEGEIQVFERETENGIKQSLRIRRLHNQRYLENEIVVNKEMKAHE